MMRLESHRNIISFMFWKCRNVETSLKAWGPRSLTILRPATEVQLLLISSTGSWPGRPQKPCGLSQCSGSAGVDTYTLGSESKAAKYFYFVETKEGKKELAKYTGLPDPLHMRRSLRDLFAFSWWKTCILMSYLRGKYILLITWNELVNFINRWIKFTSAVFSGKASPIDSPYSWWLCFIKLPQILGEWILNLCF